MAKLRPSGPELLERRLTRVRVDRTIDAPADTIWKIVSDPGLRTTWYPASDEFTPKTAQTTGVGAVFAEREWLWKATTDIVLWDEGRRIGLSTNSLNFPGLLRKLYTEFSLDPIDDTTTNVTIAGAFSFGPVGWLLVPYTFPQMTGSMWFDYRGALRSLEKMTKQ